MPERVRVKICGVTYPADAEAAGRAGADALGLNFFPPSPRFVSDAQALAIVRAAPPFVALVGVFANETPERFAARVTSLGLHAVQLHGDLLDPAALGVPLIAAVAVCDAGSLAETAHYLERCRQAGRLPAALLVDAHVAGLYGGTGRTAPWELLADFRPGVPVILAGGLSADNVAEAIRRVRPYAVDVASGVESSAGRKDAEKIRRFVDAVRAAE
jgi:phosphoribosylanthranilate isomerase